MAPVNLLPPARLERVLVVDDIPENIFLIQTILEAEGYEILTATDGQTVLTSVEAQTPDLVLMGVMSNLQGYTLTRQIRQLQLPYVPILLITADPRPAVAEGLDAGADDFIRKPVAYEDLIARVRSLLRLKHSLDAQEEITRQREDLVSRLTHDLRTPLIAMQRMLVLLQTQTLGQLTPELLTAVVTLYRNNHNLLSRVNNLLDVYRYESGAKSLQPVPVELQMLLQQVCADLQPLADQKHLELRLDLGESAILLNADPPELRRVLLNLIDNAIKFTEQGWVEIGVQVVPTAPAPTHPATHSESAAAPKPVGRQVLITIQDSGPGMSLETQSQIFERLPPQSLGTGGSGLGLYLSRLIVELHGGKLAFVSSPISGTCCQVMLPLDGPSPNARQGDGLGDR